MHRRLLGAAAVLAALSIVYPLAGCASVDHSIALSRNTVVPLVSGDTAIVSADDLAEAMLRAGFTRSAILEHGPDIHYAIATAGSAQVRDGKLVSAVFAVHGEQLYVTSRLRGRLPCHEASATPRRTAPTGKGAAQVINQSSSPWPFL